MRLLEFFMMQRYFIRALNAIVACDINAMPSNTFPILFVEVECKI